MNAVKYVAIVLVITWSAVSVQAVGITGVSIPAGSHDATSYPRDSGVWSVSAPPYPLNTSIGIGHILNPNVAGNYSMHDHVYVSPNIPGPTRAIVTYEFNVSVAVDQVEIMQHRNGISRIEGLVGNSLGSMVSIGSIFGPAGDVTGANVFGEHSSYVFDFDNTETGRFFQMVIRKTSAANGYASYQIFPRDAEGTRFEPIPIPEPATLSFVALGALMLASRKGRRGRAAPEQANR